mmetsp:Transcript_14909/g.35521  ORF Transcript_14909/g.35521 Transcript_14909/m.35521 type:complete len:276 (-) Transcript_14909:673-1500(-)
MRCMECPASGEGGLRSSRQARGGAIDLEGRARHSPRPLTWLRRSRRPPFQVKPSHQLLLPLVAPPEGAVGAADPPLVAEPCSHQSGRLGLGARVGPVYQSGQKALGSSAVLPTGGAMYTGYSAGGVGHSANGGGGRGLWRQSSSSEEVHLLVAEASLRLSSDLPLSSSLDRMRRSMYLRRSTTHSAIFLCPRSVGWSRSLMRSRSMRWSPPEPSRKSSPQSTKCTKLYLSAKSRSSSLVLSTPSVYLLGHSLRTFSASGRIAWRTIFTLQSLRCK